MISKHRLCSIFWTKRDERPPLPKICPVFGSTPYEVFYIDDSLTYVVEIVSEVELAPDAAVTSLDTLESLSDTLIEYIFLDDKPAIFNVEDGVLSDLEEGSELVSYILYIEESLKQ